MSGPGWPSAKDWPPKKTRPSTKRPGGSSGIVRRRESGTAKKPKAKAKAKKPNRGPKKAPKEEKDKGRR